MSKFSDLELAYFVSWYQRLADGLEDMNMKETAGDVRHAAFVVETLMNERNIGKVGRSDLEGGSK